MLYTDVHTLYLSICVRFNSAETLLNALLERLFAFLLKLPFIGQWIHMRAHNLTRTGRVLNSFNIRKTRRTHFLKLFRGKKKYLIVLTIETISRAICIHIIYMLYAFRYTRAPAGLYTGFCLGVTATNCFGPFNTLFFYSSSFP